MGTCSAVAMMVICLDVSRHPTPLLSPVLTSLTELAVRVNIFQPKALVCGGCGYCRGAEGIGAAARLWCWSLVF